MTENWGILSSCTRLLSWVASIEKLLLYSPSFSSRRNLGVGYNPCYEDIKCLTEIRCCWKEIQKLLKRNPKAVNWEYISKSSVHLSWPLPAMALCPSTCRIGSATSSPCNRGNSVSYGAVVSTWHS